jgi:hypothetical protein
LSPGVRTRHCNGLNYQIGRGRCPLWVRSRHVRRKTSCPLCPQ